MNGRCLLAAGLLPLVGCADRSAIVRRELEAADRVGLAILSPFSLRAVSPTGRYLGDLRLDNYDPSLFSVSPDGKVVAWLPRTVHNMNPQPPVYVRIKTSSTKSYELKIAGLFATAIAISAKAPRTIALLWHGETNDFRVVLVNSETSAIFEDLTDLLGEIKAADVIRLSIDHDGRVLAVGTRTDFCVLDIPSRKVILNGAGGFPSLSPSGNALAIKDSHDGGIVLDLQRNRKILGGGLNGVAMWSPDGKLLLAGKVAWFRQYIVAFDASAGRSYPLMTVPIDDFSAFEAWISSDLLSR